MTSDLQEIKQILAEADCLATPDQVEAALDAMAAQITERIGERNPLVYSVMNGGLVLAGRLLCRLGFPLEVGYLHATRYGRALSGSTIDWRVPPSHDLKGRTVLVLDDILDEGITLAAIVERLRADGAEAVYTAVLVHKLHERKAYPGMRADFSGLDIADRYLFGCGMDVRGYWRNAPGIYALKGH